MNNCFSTILDLNIRELKDEIEDKNIGSALANHIITAQAVNCLLITDL